LSTALPLQKTYYPPDMQEPDLTAWMKAPKELGQKLRPDQVAGMNCMSVASAVRDKWHLNDEPPDTPVSQQKEYYYGNGMLRNNWPGGPNTTYTNLETNPYTDPEAQAACAAHKAAVAREEAYNAMHGEAVLDEWQELKGEALEEEGMGNATKRRSDVDKPKVLTGTAALQASSIPLNLGFVVPKTTAQASFTDPAGRDYNPNGGMGVTNSHNMPTCCITGMAPMGLPGRPNKSGPEPVVKGFRKRRPATAGVGRAKPGTPAPTSAHQDFMRRMNKSVTARGRPMTAGSQRQ